MVDQKGRASKGLERRRKQQALPLGVKGKAVLCSSIEGKTVSYVSYED
jgi:hypothetical protein